MPVVEVVSRWLNRLPIEGSGQVAGGPYGRVQSKDPVKQPRRILLTVVDQVGRTELDNEGWAVPLIRDPSRATRAYGRSGGAPTTACRTTVAHSQLGSPCSQRRTQRATPSRFDIQQYIVEVRLDGNHQPLFASRAMQPIYVPFPYALPYRLAYMGFVLAGVENPAQEGFGLHLLVDAHPVAAEIDRGRTGDTVPPPPPTCHVRRRPAGSGEVLVRRPTANHVMASRQRDHRTARQSACSSRTCSASAACRLRPT